MPIEVILERGQAVLRRAHASGRVRAMRLFAGSYLADWTLVGVAVYTLYRPYASFAAGAIAIAADVYEFTPLNGYCGRLGCPLGSRAKSIFVQ